MKRRTFLRMLSLAPVAAAVPAMALPRPDKPTDIDSLKIDVSGPEPETMRRLMDDIDKDQAKFLERVTSVKDDENGEQHGLVVDGRPVKCKFPVSAIKGDAEIVLFKDGQLMIRPARINS